MYTAGLRRLFVSDKLVNGKMNFANKPKRSVAIDAIKGLCIILVVFGHTPNAGLLQKELYNFVQILYTFHVPIFILLSAFFFQINLKKGYGIKDVARKLILPYFVVSLLFMLGWLIAGRLDNPITLVGIFRGEGGGALWFLYYLFLFQLSVICAKKLVDFDHTKEVFKVDEIVLAGTFSCFFLMILGHPQPTYFFIYFFLGYCMGKFVKEIPANINYLGLAFVVFMLFDVSRGKVCNILWVYSLVIGLNGMFSKLESFKCVLILAYIGRSSLIIFLLHPFFIAPIKHFGYYILSFEPYGIMLKVACTIFSVFLCLVVDEVVCRIRQRLC